MAIWEFGKSGLLTREDTYDDNTESVFDKNLGSESVAQEVIISCTAKRRRVSSYLSEPLRFSAKANWQEMFGGGVMSIAGTGLGLLTDLAQYGKGWTVQQPWMNRKMYKSTNPLSFSVKLPFVATSDATASAEVFEPLQTLMSFCYPRLLSNKSGTGDKSALEGIFGDGESMQLAEKKGNLANRAQDDMSGIDSEDLGILPGFINAIKAYAIPGPGLRFGMQSDKDVQGDNVAVYIGNYLMFKACYLESVEVEFSEVMTPSGYPVSGSATVQVTCMEANYCLNDGTFYFDGFDDRQSDLTNLLDACNGAAKKVAKSFAQLKNATVGFWTGGGK